MFCTGKEQLTCNEEKMTCEGCYYNKEDISIEPLIEELTKVNPANLSEEGLKLFNKIMEIIDRNEELKKENRFLKYHKYTNICQCCKKEFYSKRPNVLWCKNCRTKMYNINYYANLSEDKKKGKAEKSKIAMRKYRSKLQEGDDK